MNKAFFHRLPSPLFLALLLILITGCQKKQIRTPSQPIPKPPPPQSPPQRQTLSPKQNPSQKPFTAKIKEELHYTQRTPEDIRENLLFSSRPGPADDNIRRQRRKIVKIAQKYLNHRRMVCRSGSGIRFRSDCSNWVRCVYSYAGLDIMRPPDNPSGNGVLLIRKFVQAYGTLHKNHRPAVGDLVFWHYTYDKNRDGLYNDRWTHIGIVESVDKRGRISILHYSKTIKRLFMYLDDPNLAYTRKKHHIFIRQSKNPRACHRYRQLIQYCSRNYRRRTCPRLRRKIRHSCRSRSRKYSSSRKCRRSRQIYRFCLKKYGWKRCRTARKRVRRHCSSHSRKYSSSRKCSSYKRRYRYCSSRYRRHHCPHLRRMKRRYCSFRLIKKTRWRYYWNSILVSKRRQLKPRRHLTGQLFAAFGTILQLPKEKNDYISSKKKRTFSKRPFSFATIQPFSFHSPTSLSFSRLR